MKSLNNALDRLLVPGISKSTQETDPHTLYSSVDEVLDGVCDLCCIRFNKNLTSNICSLCQAFYP